MKNRIGSTFFQMVRRNANRQKNQSSGRDMMVRTTQQTTTTRRNQRGPRRNTVDLIPMQVSTIPSQLRLNTRATIEVGQETIRNYYYSAGQILQSPSTVTSGVKNFDSKAYKFFSIYRYWRCVQITATVANTTSSTANSTIFVGWAPGETSTYGIADLLDNDVSMSVGSGQGRGVMVVSRNHTLPNGMWRRTREQELITIGGVTQVLPSSEEVTQGALGVIATGGGDGQAGLLTLESVWEFKEFL